MNHYHFATALNGCVKLSLTRMVICGKVAHDELPKTVGTIWCKHSACRGRIV